MRRVNRSALLVPAELNSTASDSHLQQIIADPHNIFADKKFYRGLQILPSGVEVFTVVNALRDLYKNKCAYCEAYACDPEIDHHRPKKKPRGLGYYWLVYEWTNLLPSCSDCNKISAKGSNYPTGAAPNITHPLAPGLTTLCLNSFAYSCAFNANEKALLLHPEYCNPEEHFNFEVDGSMEGISLRGIRTVEVLKLNRDTLKLSRRKVYDTFKSELDRILLKRFDVTPISEDYFQDRIHEWYVNIKNSCNDKVEYTLFIKFLFLNIEYAFIGQVDIAYQSELRGAVRKSILKLVTP